MVLHVSVHFLRLAVISQCYLGLFCFSWGSNRNVRWDFLVVFFFCQRNFTLDVWFSQSMYEPPDWSTVFSLTRSIWSLINLTIFHELENPPRMSTFRHLCRHNCSWSCYQTKLPWHVQSALSHTKSNMSWGHRNIRAVKSNEATRLPLELCLSDPLLVQIIMPGSLTWPGLEMWLMSHLDSEDLGAGFERGIKATASFIGNMGSQCPWWEMGVCNGIFGVIKITNDFA